MTLRRPVRAAGGRPKSSSPSTATSLNVNTFLPRVHKVEDAVIRPYALPQLLVHPLWGSQTTLVPLRSFMELAILREPAISSAIWLVNCLWLRNTSTLRLIVAFVYQGGSVVLESVL